jgi:hypothetical protein
MTDSTSDDSNVIPLNSPTKRTRRRRATQDEETRPNGGWLIAAMSAIEAESKTGREFQAADIAARYQLGEPDHPCRWGQVFAAAHREGLIRRVGATQSRRRTVRASLTSIWVGVIDELPRAA